MRLALNVQLALELLQQVPVKVAELCSQIAFFAVVLILDVLLVQRDSELVRQDHVRIARFCFNIAIFAVNTTLDALNAKPYQKCTC